MSARQVVLIVHLVGLAFGMGGAVTIDAMLVIASLRRRVTGELIEVIHVASGMVAGAMVLLAVSGTAFFFTGSAPSPKFWAKMVIVGVACLNGLAAHRLVLPLLETGVASGQGRLRLRPRAARLAAASAAISGVSWFGALVLGAWKGCPLGMAPLLAAYGVVLTGGIAISALVVAPRVFDIAPTRRRRPRGRFIDELRAEATAAAHVSALAVADGALAIAIRLGRAGGGDRAEAVAAPGLLFPNRGSTERRLPDELFGDGGALRWPRPAPDRAGC